MRNLTLSADEHLIEEGRRYAREHHTSLNAILRAFLQNLVSERKTDWVDECFEEMNAAHGRSRGKRWKREDLHRV